MSGPRPINHGTAGGYRAHYRRQEQPCDACREAENQYRGHAPFQPARHGTRSGYNRHLREGEVACEPCKAASRDEERARRHRVRAAAKEEQR